MSRLHSGSLFGKVMAVSILNSKNLNYKAKIFQEVEPPTLHGLASVKPSFAVIILRMMKNKCCYFDRKNNVLMFGGSWLGYGNYQGPL